MIVYDDDDDIYESRMKGGKGRRDFTPQRAPVTFSKKKFTRQFADTANETKEKEQEGEEESRVRSRSEKLSTE